MRNILSILFLLLTLPTTLLLAENNVKTGNPEDSTDVNGNTIYIGKKPLKNFNIDGSFNGLIYCRNMDKLFDGKQTQQKLIISNNDGGEQREMRLNFSGRPTTNTYFKTDMYIAPSMRGFGYNTATDKLGIEIGVNLEGQMNSDHGNLYFKFGGTQFTKLSKLTLWSTENKGESMFERSPWGGFQKAGSNYESYYSQGTISRDFTWGNKFLQGFTADLTNLPVGLEAKVLYAKTPSNGGQTSYLVAIPNISYGGMLRKRKGANYIGVNNFNALTYTNDVNGESIGYNIITTDFSINLLQNDITLAGELGKCKFTESSTLSETWADALDITVMSREKLIKTPITFHYFYIAPKFINLDAGYNTFLKDASVTYNGEGGDSNAEGAYMSDIDLINGNRKGGDLRTEFNVQGLKINFALGISQEAEHLTNVISYGHKINGLMFSRVYQYQRAMGMYSSMNTSYRSYYEVSTIDTTNPNYKNNALNFSVLECNLKYKLNIFDKPLYMFYLTSISSTQDYISAIPVFSDKAYMQVQYHEFEAYYKIFPKTALASYFGLEKMQGNSMMQLGVPTDVALDPTKPNELTTIYGKPTNVLGKGLGLGIDYEVNEVANLYVRGRWFDYTDKNNTFYTYKGFEGSIELRIYF